jgi:predicted metal-dependent enzyme (double-stranded beta helix superfamily)
MTADIYTLPQFVQDLRSIAAQIQDPRVITTHIRPIMRRLALAKEWLQPHHYECDGEQGFGVHLLHEELDHTLAIFAIAWLPGRGAPPHNHGTWAVVAGVDGPEKNTFWKRLDDGSRPGYAEIISEGERLFGPGEVVSFLPDDIHSVMNESEQVTVSLHLYGKHLNYTGRSQFDPGTKAVSPFMVKEQ